MFVYKVNCVHGINIIIIVVMDVEKELEIAHQVKRKAKLSEGGVVRVILRLALLV